MTSAPELAVHRVDTEDGSRIEPPLDQGWSNLRKLRWHLAVVLHDSGSGADGWAIERSVTNQWGERAESYSRFDLAYPGGAIGPLTFEAMWDTLNGVGVGLRNPRA